VRLCFIKAEGLKEIVLNQSPPLIIGRVATNNERGRGGYLKTQGVALGYFV
jgi:hypothetical protein